MIRKDPFSIRTIYKHGLLTWEVMLDEGGRAMTIDCRPWGEGRGRWLLAG